MTFYSCMKDHFPSCSAVLVLVMSTCVKVLLFPSYRSTDFEVHRNWLAITQNLPLRDWYFNATSEWTLDYPPFFAYFEYLLSTVAVAVDTSIVQLSKYGYVNNNTIVFQRSSVIITELFLFHAVVAYTKAAKLNTSNSLIVVAAVSLNAGLIMVDHIHFQYNGFLLGLLVWCCTFVHQRKYIYLMLCFSTLVLMKHLFVLSAPVVGLYLLLGFCFQQFDQFDMLKERKCPGITDSTTKSTKGPPVSSKVSEQKDSSSNVVDNNSKFTKSGNFCNIMRRIAILICIAAIFLYIAVIPFILSEAIVLSDAPEFHLTLLDDDTNNAASRSDGLSDSVSDNDGFASDANPTDVSSTDGSDRLWPLLLAVGRLLAASATAQLTQIFKRLFPFSRGLVHAYWAPNCWALYCFLDRVLYHLTRFLARTQSTNNYVQMLRSVMPISKVTDTFHSSTTSGLVEDFSPEILPKISATMCLALSVLCMVPAFVALVRAKYSRISTPHLFTRCLIYCSMCSFMFGYHVHEKAILIPIMLSALVCTYSVRTLQFFHLVSMVGIYALLPLFVSHPSVSSLVVLLYCAYMAFIGALYGTEVAASDAVDRETAIPSASSTVDNNYNNSMKWTLGIIQLCLGVTYVGTDIILPIRSLTYPGLPFLPLMITSCVCSIFLLYGWYQSFLLLFKE